MKVPFKRDTAAALAKANEDLSAVETEIVRLQSERLAKLLDADAIEIEAIDRRIGDLHRQRTVFADRMIGLEHRLAEEQRERAEEQYRQAVAAIEPRLARRTAAAVVLEKDFTPANARRFVAANNAVLDRWPDVEWPSRVFHPAYLSVERLARRVQEALEPARGHADRRPRTPGEYLARFLKADLAGFGAEEAEQARALLEDLRHAHDLAPPQDESESEQAA
jgi:hypothetical protein